MSASPNGAAPAVASAKRPLEDPSSPSAPTDLPDAKRPALDKIVKEEEASSNGASAQPDEPAEETKPNVTAVNGTSSATATDSADNHEPQADVDDSQPNPSTAQNAQAEQQPEDPNAAVDETNWIHIRAVISSAEAATCIGKGGENVSQVRKLSGAKCTVSDYSRGQVERILTVSGVQDAVAKVGDPNTRLRK